MDSGILYHSIGPEGAWGDVWMISLECQIQETDCGDFITVDSTLATIPAYTSEGDYYYSPDADTMTFHVDRPYCNHNGRLRESYG